MTRPGVGQDRLHSEAVDPVPNIPTPGTWRGMTLTVGLGYGQLIVWKVAGAASGG